MSEVRSGSWLCENAKTLNHDRRGCSSKTVLVAQRASGFNFVIELKNIILRRVSIFEFSHSQGHFRKSTPALARSALPPEADIRPASQSLERGVTCRPGTLGVLGGVRLRGENAREGTRWKDRVRDRCGVRHWSRVHPHSNHELKTQSPQALRGGGPCLADFGPICRAQSIWSRNASLRA